MFLHGKDLTDTVRDVLKGEDPRCAVAFWGTGARAFLDSAGSAAGRVRIVCDTHLGGTSHHALKELGAPDNPNLRWVRGLHAKVFVSGAGAVVGSANASRNGLALAGPAGYEEAAFFVPPGTPEWTAIGDWVDGLFARPDGDDAGPVNAAALERAKKDYRPDPMLRGGSPASLFDMVRAHPQRFASVGFVVADEWGRDLTLDEEAELAEKAKKAGVDGFTADANGMFTEWSPEEIRQWPRHFFEVWLPKRAKAQIIPRRDAIRLDTGVVCAPRGKKAVAALVGGDLPDLKAAAAIDAPRARQLLGRSGKGRLFPNGEALARALEQLEQD